jgi:hypothetical protein
MCFHGLKKKSNNFKQRDLWSVYEPGYQERNSDVPPEGANVSVTELFNVTSNQFYLNSMIFSSSDLHELLYLATTDLFSICIVIWMYTMPRVC